VSRDSYSEIHLHVVWHTKVSMPLLAPPIESFVHHHLRHRLLAEEGILVHAVGGTENHVHIALTLPPTVLISELIGRIKGSAAYEANRQFGGMDKILEWQRGYGVVSFGTRNLPWVKSYVENQRKHHTRGTTRDRLERSAPLEEKEPT
jgi:putative transposase